jgi:hypothetical protein
LKRSDDADAPKLWNDGKKNAGNDGNASRFQSRRVARDFGRLVAQRRMHGLATNDPSSPTPADRAGLL